MSAEQNKTLTLGSLFDGSGGFPLGGLLTGQITPVWSSEIEPFAIRATTKRLPQVKHYGDVSAISGADLPPVDIITFGSPCQDMSIAGKRDGLDGSRSSLFYEAIRIVKEMRCKTNGEKPRFIVWENVPGAFSSNKGQDFKAVLEAVIGVKEPSASVPAPEKKGWPDADYYVGDGWSVAYRVLDMLSQRIFCSGRHRVVCRSGRINWPAILLGRKRPGDMVGLHIGPIYTTGFAVPCVNGRT